MQNAAEALPTIHDSKNIISPTEWDYIVSALINTINTGAEFNTEISIITKENRIRNIRCIAYIQKNKSGEAKVLAGVIQDISELKSKDVELIQTKNRLTKILDSSIDIICTLDQNGFYKSVSSSCKSILGYSPEEMVEKHLSKTGKIIPIIWSAYWDATEKKMYCVARNVWRILDTEDFCMGEIWLLTANKKSLFLVAVDYNTPEMKQFFHDTTHINQISQNEGLPGIAWDRKEITYWENLGERKHFFKKE